MPAKKTTAVQKAKTTAVDTSINTELADQMQAVQESCMEVANLDMSFKSMAALDAVVRKAEEVLEIPEVKAMILRMQNIPLGFKTDERAAITGKYSKPAIVYGWKIIKPAIIQGLMNGVNPIGNQMNVISRQCYVTKEGCEFKLSNEKKVLDKLDEYYIDERNYLGYDQAIGCAHIGIVVAYRLKGGEEEKKEFKVPVKHDPRYGGPDQAFGKAERKALAWLYQRVTGAKVPDGEIEVSSHAGDIVISASDVTEVDDFYEQEEVKEEDKVYIKLLLSDDSFEEKTRQGWLAALDHLEPQNVERSISQLGAHIKRNNGVIPQRKKG